MSAFGGKADIARASASAIGP